MFQESSKEYLISALKSLGINEINQVNINALELFYYNLVEWNKNINLTRIIDEKDFITKHIIDSLTVLKALKETENLRIIDIGTGAGFPVLPFWIFFPNNKITLLDSVKKKLNFIEDTVNKLNKLDSSYKLENVEIIHSRAEDLAHNPDYREQFDISLSRAVSSLNTLVELNLPFLKYSSFMIAMKGDKIEDEVKNAQHVLRKLGGDIKKTISFDLFETDMKRNLIVIKKITKTPKSYPRKSPLPQKSPL